MTKEQLFINQLQLRFNWKVVFIIALFFIVLIKLGFWQLHRAELKRQIQAQQQQQQSAIPIAIENLATQPLKIINYKQVLLTGHYINEKSIYISNKLYQGKPGFEVFTPFKLKSNAQIVLISRGFVAMPYQQKQLPSINLINGEQHLLGSIYLPSRNSFFLKEKVQSRKWPLRLHHFNIETIVERLQSPVTPYIVRLAKGHQGILEPFWPAISSNPGRSTAYAIQWFVMAFGLLVISFIRSSNIIQLIQSK